MSASRISQAKLDANRRNAQRSTGPTTERGKRAVRLNATTHGLTARDIVINAGDCRENEDLFNATMAKFRRDLKPVGVLEELLVDTIVECYWRLARARRFEAGSIRQYGDAVRARVDRRRVELCAAAIALHEGEALRRMTRGVEYLLQQLNLITEDVRAGRFTEESEKWLLSFFGDRVSIKCDALDRGGSGTSISNEIQILLLEALEGERRSLCIELEEAKQNEDLKIDAHVAALALPSQIAIDRLRRYEGPIFRELHRTLAELRRCQDRRRGGISAKQSHGRHGHESMPRRIARDIAPTGR